MKALAIKKSDETPEQRMVWGEVYAPDRPDAYNDFMTAEEIRKMAHDFVRKGRMDQVDVQHDNETVPGVVIVESFIARKGDPDFIEGSWVVGCHINDDALWEKVKKGELNGFSMEALAFCEDKDIEVEIPPVISGTTSKNSEHVHKFYVAFDDEGNFLGGKTDTVDGHSHDILIGTATEEASGHNHRFSAVDDIRITSVD